MGYSDGGCDPVLSSFEGHERDNNSGGGGGGGGGGGHASDSDTNSELNNDNVTAPPAAKRLKTTATISQVCTMNYDFMEIYNAWFFLFEVLDILCNFDE